MQRQENAGFNPLVKTKTIRGVVFWFVTIAGLIGSLCDAYTVSGLKPSTKKVGS
mgnify:CR=1 FL=1|jgi:hypothetical protein